MIFHIISENLPLKNPFFLFEPRKKPFVTALTQGMILTPAGRVDGYFARAMR